MSAKAITGALQGRDAGRLQEQGTGALCCRPLKAHRHRVPLTRAMHACRYSAIVQKQASSRLMRSQCDPNITLRATIVRVLGDSGTLRMQMLLTRPSNRQPVSSCSSPSAASTGTRCPNGFLTSAQLAALIVGSVRAGPTTAACMPEAFVLNVACRLALHATSVTIDCRAQQGT
jgi:hypothetical protein